jgi:Uma2 family endonuclease
MEMATKAKHWTLEELHALPDDGNKYELVFGDLFVTPPPSVAHETLAAILGRILDRYVERWALGLVYRPRAVIQTPDGEVEPDLMVRPATSRVVERWTEMPIPSLVVEVLSASTRRRDVGPKREFYIEAGVPTYWIVDGEARTVRVVRPGQLDAIVADSVSWHPAGAGEPLVIDVSSVFREALGS